jgi:serine/threonine protein kinase/tetratricopeptide (TPR) repeat protein
MTSGNTGIVNDRWERLQELFSRAVELSESERETFITRETSGDLELRDELLGLLACDSGKSTGPLTNALGAALDATTRDRRRAYLGRVVGNYKLVSVLGHGGTGTVYLGERADRQYSAQVAVKIVESANVQGDLGMRFKAERQILASLNHANIARLIDAGETPDGQPYLVMEYVHGEPLDRFCDRERLDIRKRLTLFLDICSAVQYAHQNLIVHRDLKPANILVTGESSPKLLDFGIAKLLDTGDAASMLALTRMNDRLLTPEYASPEQILGRAVTTASDVYALGVVLYELLTGLRPYVVPSSASQLELERSICVSDPPKPSAMVKRATDAGLVAGQTPFATLALARGLTPERLASRLVGDIDSIVMRALRKEPQHRYGSVEQLTGDIRRYLNREPVSARQGNWLYYSQRFVRRHAFGVFAGSVFVALIVGFAVVTSVQSQRLAAERDRATRESEAADKVLRLMLDAFSATEPASNLGRVITAQDVLEQAARTIQATDMADQPEVRARLLEGIGRAFRSQAHVERAIPYLEDAVRIRESMPVRDPLAIASALTELAVALRTAGRFDESDLKFRAALDLSHSMKTEHSRMHARLLVDLGRLELFQGRVADAESHLQQALELTREILGPRRPEVAAILLDLVSARSWRDDLADAERDATEAVNIYRETTKELHPDRVTADLRLAEVLLLRGRTNDAGDLYERALGAERILYGDNSTLVGDTLSALARVRLAQGRPLDAEKLAREGLGIYAAARKEAHSDTGYLQAVLAQILTQRGAYEEAEVLLRQALLIFDKTLPVDHQYVAMTEYLLGEVLISTGRLTDAESMLEASMNRWKRTGAPLWRAARSEAALGEAIFKQHAGRTEEAESHLVNGYRVVAREPGSDAESKRRAQERVVRFYTDTGQRTKLDALLPSRQPNSVAASRPAN